MKIKCVRKVGKNIVAYSEQNFAYVLKHEFKHRDDPKISQTLQRIREKLEIEIRFWRVAQKWER